MTQRGSFISFESIDGLGKTTQIKLLGEALKNSGFPVFMTKEPGDANMGSNVGAGIRELVFKKPSTLNMRPGVADCLFLADHIQTAGDIAEAVEAGQVVLCDRYADSQFAYAASEGKNCPAWALKAYQDNFGIIPDLTILFVARGHVPEIYGGTGDAEDIQWALNRAMVRLGPEAGKQAAKAWNTAAEQRRIQEAYLRNIGSKPRTSIVEVWEEDSIEFIHYKVLATALCQTNLYRLLPSSDTLVASLTVKLDY